MLERDGEDLSLDDIIALVGGDIPANVLIDKLRMGQNAEAVSQGTDLSKKLDAILADPTIKVPRWMKNPQHRGLAERLVGSPLWESAPEKKHLRLIIVKQHFKGTDMTIVSIPQQIQRRHGRLVHA